MNQCNRGSRPQTKFNFKKIDSPSSLHMLIQQNRQNLAFSNAGTNDFQDKQFIRELITDFVMHQLYDTKKKSYTKKNKDILAPKIHVAVQVNGNKKQLSLEFLKILEKYIEVQTKSIYRHSNIQPLIVDILDFLDQIHELTQQISFQIPQQDRKLKEKIIKSLIEKHHKKKKAQMLNKQFRDSLKRKTVAKYTRISYLDLNNMQKRSCQFFVQKSQSSQGLNRVSRNNMADFQPKNLKKAVDSNFLAFVSHMNVFNRVQQLQTMKKQKLKKFYQCNKNTFQAYEQQSKERFKVNVEKNQLYNVKMQGFIENWISEINLSEKLYKQRYAKGHKRNQRLFIQAQQNDKQTQGAVTQKDAIIQEENSNCFLKSQFQVSGLDLNTHKQDSSQHMVSINCFKQ